MSADAQPPIEAQGQSGSGLAGLLGSVISAGKGILARRRQAAAEAPSGDLLAKCQQLLHQMVEMAVVHGQGLVGMAQTFLNMIQELLVIGKQLSLLIVVLAIQLLLLVRIILITWFKELREMVMMEHGIFTLILIIL